MVCKLYAYFPIQALLNSKAVKEMISKAGSEGLTPSGSHLVSLEPLKSPKEKLLREKNGGEATFAKGTLMTLDVVMQLVIRSLQETLGPYFLWGFIWKGLPEFPLEISHGNSIWQFHCLLEP